MDTSILSEDSWPRVLSYLGDVEESARATGAFRRKRKFENASSLLRTLLAYGAGSLSLRSVSAWADAEELASVSSVALFYRLQSGQKWLATLLMQVLERSSQQKEPSPASSLGLRVRLVDATVLCGPRSLGTEFRVHAVYDPQRAKLTRLELTDEHGGEGLWRFGAEEGDLLLADSGYGTARSYRWALAQGAHVLLRVTPTNLRAENGAEERFDLKSWAQGAGQRPQSVGVYLPKDREAPRARVRLIRFLSPKGTLVVLMTSLDEPQASDRQLVDLYRLRWQVELLFKRWKSLARLGDLPKAHQGPSARAWILLRLLFVALAQEALGPMSGGERRKERVYGGSRSARSTPSAPAFSETAFGA